MTQIIPQIQPSAEPLPMVAATQMKKKKMTYLLLRPKNTAALNPIMIPANGTGVDA